MMTKYSFDLAGSALSREFSRLTNQLWKLLPMKENGEDWEKQLASVQIEIAGLGKLFNNEEEFVQLLAKIEGLGVIEEDSLPFGIYRKTIFECIGILQRLKQRYGE